MRCPYHFWCGIVLGLAVVTGCTNKKTESESGNSEPAQNPPGQAANKDQAERTQTPSNAANNQPSGGSRRFGGGTAGTSKSNGNGSSKKESVDTNAQPTVTPAENASTAGTEKVDLVHCRFDKVEAALSAAKGKVVLVDCWARWCPPCIQSFPKLVEKHTKYGSRGLVCMSVSLDSGRKAYTPVQVLAFLQSQNATFQNFYLTDLRADASAMDARFGKIEGIPHAVLFNKQGKKIWEGHPMSPEVITKIETELAR